MYEEMRRWVGSEKRSRLATRDGERGMRTGDRKTVELHCCEWARVTFYTHDYVTRAAQPVIESNHESPYDVLDLVSISADVLQTVKREFSFCAFLWGPHGEVSIFTDNERPVHDMMLKRSGLHRIASISLNEFGISDHKEPARARYGSCKPLTPTTWS